MIIYLDKKERILSCGGPGIQRKGQTIIDVPDKSIPKDFLATFALGKYTIRKEKIIENKSFKPLNPKSLPFFPFLPEEFFQTIPSSEIGKDNVKKERGGQVASKPGSRQAGTGKTKKAGKTKKRKTTRSSSS